MHSLPFIHSFLLSFSPFSALAVSIPFSLRTSDTTHLHLPRQPSTSSVVPVGNTQNAVYYSNITLGGRQISVMLDTGSSDLWVTGSVPGAQDTGTSLSLSYAIGKLTGDVYTAPFQFDGYTVNDQAFLMVANASSFSTNIDTEGFDGLLGLGPNSGSSIYKKLSGQSGNNAINRIFQQNSSLDSYITLMLNRSSDPGSQIAGQFTISSIVPEFENITNQPKLLVEKVYKLTDKDQHWQILTDKDVGIIGPDGQPIQYKSIVPKAPDGQLVAVLDSGYTYSQVPRSVSDALYGRVQGAEWSTSSQSWLVPCGQLINVTLNFGGSSFPVHPLDVSSSDAGVTFSNGDPACLGTFQPISSAFSLLGEYDLILGMPFLRNTYTLINFGDLVKGGSSSSAPYVQLLSLTDETAAVNEFIKVRLNGQNLVNSSQYTLLPASQGQHSPETEAEKKAQYEERVLSHWPYILSGCLLVVFLLIAYTVWRCCCRRKRLAKKKAATQQAGVEQGRSGAGSYSQLLDSGSTASLVMKPMRAHDTAFTPR